MNCLIDNQLLKELQSYLRSQSSDFNPLTSNTIANVTTAIPATVRIPANTL